LGLPHYAYEVVNVAHGRGGLASGQSALGRLQLQVEIAQHLADIVVHVSRQRLSLLHGSQIPLLPHRSIVCAPSFCDIANHDQPSDRCFIMTEQGLKAKLMARILAIDFCD